MHSYGAQAVMNKPGARGLVEVLFLSPDFEFTYIFFTCSVEDLE